MHLLADRGLSELRMWNLFKRRTTIETTTQSIASSVQSDDQASDRDHDTNQQANRLTIPPEMAKELIKADPCPFCRGLHTRYCGRVKRMAGHLPDELTEVEFWRDDEWQQDTVIWLDDLQAIIDAEPKEKA